MARAPSITRAIAALAKARIEIARVEITKDGTTKIITGKPEQPTVNGNPWDEVLNHAEH